MGRGSPPRGVTGGDITRYERGAWTDPRTAREVMYELCRESGISEASSRKFSDQGAAQLHADLAGEERRAARSGQSVPAPLQRPRLRVPFPWEKE